MPEVSGDDQLRPTPKDIINTEVQEPIGDVIIGKIDPRTLSREEFERSPELLFHGAEKDFVFKRTLILGPNSETIGRGFYTTDDKKNAEFYSRVRKNFKGDPVVLSVLPYQARMLDLRTKGNKLCNAPVSYDFAKEYLDFISASFDGKYPSDYIPDFKLPLSAEAIGFMALNSYRNELRDFIQKHKGQSLELRSLISGRGNQSLSEKGSSYFTQFMLDKGYDGLICNEGGDHPDQKHTTSLVFYNLEKIGVYETWHSEGKAE